MKTCAVHLLIVSLLLALLAGCGVKNGQGRASARGTAQARVDESTGLLADSLAEDPNGRLHELLRQARGVMLIPAIGDIGFIFSVGTGNALMTARTDHGWTGPVFMSRTTVGWGLQAGVTKQSGLLLIMHEEDVRYILEKGGVLQGQARAVVLNRELEPNETDSFQQSGDIYFVGERTGLYAGIALDAGGFSNRTNLNEAFTGVVGGAPETILFDRKIRPHGAERLLEMLDAAGPPTPENEKDGTEVPSN